MSRPRKRPAHLASKARHEAKRRAEMKRRRSGKRSKRKTQKQRAPNRFLQQFMSLGWLRETYKTDIVHPFYLRPQGK